MNIKNILVSIAMLAGGVAIGWVIRPAPPPTAEPVEEKVPRAKERVADVGAEASRDALRRRVKELERELAEARAARPEMPPAAPTGEVKVATEQRRFGPPSPAEFRARMEEMREKNPEQYAQMTNNMARFREFGLRRASNRLDTLASVDTSRMTKKELAIHEKLQELIAREQELHDIARPDNQNTTDEERAAAWNELRELGREKHELERAERDTLLSKAAESYGVSGAEAKELVETVKAVYQATESGWGGPRGGGRGRGRRGR